MNAKTALVLVTISAAVGVAAGFGVDALRPDDRPGPKATASASTPSPSESPAHAIGALAVDRNLIGASELERLPLYDGSHPEAGPGEWQVDDAKDVPTLACQQEWLVGLDPVEIVTREFTTEPNEGGGGGRVHTAVLQFDTVPAADRAFGVVQQWLGDCSNLVTKSLGEVFRDVESKDFLLPGTELGLKQRVTYAAPEVCTECDGAWFDELAVVLTGQRLVLVSHAEVGGPLPPEGLGARADETIEVVVAAAQR